MTFKIKLIFIFLSWIYLQYAFSASIVAQYTSKKTCRSYFIQSDVLSLFTTDEKSSLETAASTLADLLGKADSTDRHAKEDLDTSLQKILVSKKLNEFERSEFKLWFESRVQYYLHLKREDSRQRSSTHQLHTETLKRQKTLFKRQAEEYQKVQQEYKKVQQILNKYRTKTLSKALEVAFYSEDKMPNWQNDILFILDRFRKLRLSGDLFLIAVQYDHLPAISYFISKGANLNFQDPNKNLALHLAAKYNRNPNVVQLLLQTAASPQFNIGNKQGKTSLHFAAENKNPEILKMLLEAGADPNLKTTQDHLPLHFAAKNSYMDKKSIRLLIELTNKELIDTENVESQTPLHVATEHKHFETAEVLLEMGSNPTLQDSDKKTPWELANEFSFGQKEYSPQELEERVSRLYQAIEKWKRDHP